MELIPLVSHRIGKDTIQTVEARKLHVFLEVKTKFNDWITKRIATYGFVEGVDFTVTIYRNGYGACHVKEYTLTPECAEILQAGERRRTRKAPVQNQYVYAVQHGDTQYVKLGQTRNYVTRLIGLQSSNPIPLSFLGVWQVESGPVVEKLLHIKFVGFASSGDWFALSLYALTELFAYMSRYERVI